MLWPWFLGHTQSSSGLTPGSMLRDYSWWVQGAIWGVGLRSEDWFLCKAIASFTILSLSPSEALSLRNLFLIAFNSQLWELLSRERVSCLPVAFHSGCVLNHLGKIFPTLMLGVSLPWILILFIQSVSALKALQSL